MLHFLLPLAAESVQRAAIAWSFDRGINGIVFGRFFVEIRNMGLLNCLHIAAKY